MEDEFDCLQRILGTNKKNRVFSVYKHSQTGDFHVYYGLELFEIVPPDREDTRFKLMVAHLLNIGMTFADLHAQFKINPRTIKKWSDALKSGDAQKLTQALAGRQVTRKLTPAAQQYVRIRFPYIYENDRYTYSSKIRSELKAVLNVEVSGETLRPLFTELKKQINGEAPSLDSNHDDEEMPNPSAHENSDTRCDDNNDDDDNSPSPPATTSSPRSGNPPAIEPSPKSSTTLELSTNESRSADRNRKMFTKGNRACWCSHLGVLIFSEGLHSLSKSLSEESAPAICQWSSQILLGALNLEQTKLQSGSDLSLILGSELLGTPDHQRKKLSELANTPDLAEQILKWNFKHIGGEQMSDLYFDPHTKNYTGKQNILKGWCSKMRWAAKIMNGDYVHSVSGQPIYFENTDNYEDMRQRFKKLESRYRQCFDIEEQRILTWIIDRGIYSKDMLEWFLEGLYRHIITWEKDYKGDGWPEGRECSGKMEVERERNNSSDRRTYRFEWIEDKWPKDKEQRIRRIIVRASNPQGNSIEVSILCDDQDRDAKEIVWLMFDRWVQENDFKYLDVHFGINEITSYRSETYAAIKNEIDDRIITNSAYSALSKSKGNQLKALGDLLVKNRRAERKKEERTRLIQKLAEQTELNPEQRKELGRLKAGQNTAQKYHDQRDEKILSIEGRIEDLELKMSQTSKEVSRLDALIDKGAVRLCGERKYLMDVVKITARNMFYKMLAPFKESYDNYRDDHEWFRHLSQSGGVFIPGEKEHEASRGYLIGTADFPKSVRRALNKCLAQFNQSESTLPDGSGKKIELYLAEKSALEVAITKV